MSLASSTTRLEVFSRIRLLNAYNIINSNRIVASLVLGNSSLPSTNNHECRRRHLSTATTGSIRRSFTSSSTSSSTSSMNQPQHYDAIIAGGGTVGSVLARLLLDDNFGSNGFHASNTGKNRRRPLRVALIEARPSPTSLKDLIAKNNSQETQSLSTSLPSPSSSTSSTPPDPRAYALSPTSLSYLGPSILQSLLHHNRVGMYNNMQIWEHDGPAQLHFVGEDLSKAIRDGRLVDLNDMIHGSHDDSNGDDGGEVVTNSRKRPWLGAVIEDAPLVSSLWDELRLDSRIDLVDNAQITSIDAPSPQEVGNVIPPAPVKLSFMQRRLNHKKYKDTGNDEETVRTITSNLLVAADGANSFVRRTIGNFPMTTHSYGRKAVTCTVLLESELKHTAYQRFLPHGPIALLPVRNGSINEEGKDTQTGGGGDDAPIYANVVWSTTPTEANHLLSLSASEFLSKLNYHLRQGPNVNPSILPQDSTITSNIPLVSSIVQEVDSLLRTANSAITMGTWTESPSRNYFRLPPKSIDVVSPIMGFDLGMSHVRDYTYASRVALVGDAAHTMHPMAGQGLNLGLDDVSSLAKLIKEAIDAGMDVGGTSLFLDRYNQERLVKGWGIVAGVHGLHELFGCSTSSDSSNSGRSNLHGIMNDGASRDRNTSSAWGLRNLIGYSRSLGMNVVNGLPFVRQTLAEVAAGATPPFPK